MSKTREVAILLDNGSLRAAAVMQLRVIATALGEKLGKTVHPVSLLHSSKIEANELGGVKAQTLVPFLKKQKNAGYSRFIIVPLFFGPSGALVDYLPKRLDDLRDEGWEDLEVHVCSTLVEEGDDRIARILADLIRDEKKASGFTQASVAMCDHGTPSRAVNEVREIVAAQLSSIFSEQVKVVKSCSMERREGSEYDFNEPLLENLIGTPKFNEKVIVSMLFLLPGRHAGEKGDVAQICEAAEVKSPTLETVMTGLVGSKVDDLTDILKDRFYGAARR